MGRNSKKCQLQTESVTFNILNPRELAMYKHVNQQTNKSGYLKHLVEMDLLGALRFHSVFSDTTPAKNEEIKARQKPENLLDAWMSD